MRSNKNKWLSILAAICITAMMFAGCGEKGVEDNLPTSTPDTAETTGTPMASADTETPEGSTGPTATSADTRATYPSGGGGGSSVISTVTSAVDDVVNSLTGDQKLEDGTFQLMVSDRPADIDDFEHLNVTLSKARIFRVGGYNYGYGYGYSNGYPVEDGQGRWYEIKDLDKTVDLTQLVGERATPVADIGLDPGKYTKVELYVEDVKATLKEDGKDANVKVPSGKLMITKNFEIIPEETTTFVFDINVVKKGRWGNDYNLQPVISESGVVGKDLKHVEVVND